MREIKFRVWDSGIKKLVYIWDIFDFTDNRDWKNEWFFNKEDTIFMQYTGLKDKNWKEIYEWDIIVELENNMNKCVVEWSEIACWFFPFTHYDNQIQGNKPRSYEIIWNIYENSNLLINN